MRYTCEEIASVTLYGPIFFQSSQMIPAFAALTIPARMFNNNLSIIDNKNENSAGAKLSGSVSKIRGVHR